MPSYLIDMNYDGRWVKKTADRFYFLGQPAGWLFVAMAGFYLMLLLFGVDPWLSIAGGLGYGLSSYFVIIIGAGHIKCELTTFTKERLPAIAFKIADTEIGVEE